MRRSRVLEALSRASANREAEGQRREDAVSRVDGDQENVESKPPEAPPSTRGSRGGRILSQLAKNRVETRPAQQVDPAPQEPQERVSREQQQRSTTQQRSSSSESSGRPVPALTRQDSDVSRSSVISQHFAQVEETDYKATLPKVKSTAGAPQKLGLNYMTFETNEGCNIEEYHVDFSPNIESIKLRYTLLRSDTAKEIIGSVIHWTGTNLYLPIKLPNKITTFTTNHPVDNIQVRVSLTFIKSPPDSELLPFYNSLMHKVMNRLKYVIINRQHYSPSLKISIEQYKLEVWPGWITSIQRLDGGLKLSVDASFRVLRLETVRDIMMEIKNRCRGMNLKEAFEQELVGSIIMTRYNNKAYRIDEIDITKKPSDTFLSTKENKQISYVDYMRTQWDVTVRDLHQPMIVHRPKPKRGQVGQEPETVYLIPELCVTTGLTDSMRQNFSIMKAIDSHTKLAPDLRESKLAGFLSEISTDERAVSVLREWNLKVKPVQDVVEGRKLDNEILLFGENRTFKVSENVDWTRPATTGPMLKSVPIENWVIMYTERDEGQALEFLGHIRDVSRSLHIKFSEPRKVRLPNDAPTTYVNAGKREVKRTDQMVVILTPGRGQREDRYSACKRLYSCELPVPCQFIRVGTISNPAKVRSICSKVVIQILSKVGGQPWGMKFPMASFMIVGMDVYHDTIDRKKSCVGFVASMNATTSSWWSRTFFQNSLEEIGQKLSATLVSALRKYHSLNGSIPQKIIVYRDGVGDGQMEAVVELEVAQVMNAVKFYMRDSHAGIDLPALSYVIVQKRINAKLSLRSGNRTMNPLPGTYLDHTITHPEYNDFYLVSQHVNQGTVSPTKYVVITETGILKMEHHQKLAYKMTHMYYNWCGTIRVPAPCQYAHKLAYLTGQNIRAQANEKMEDKLYFL